MGWSPVYFGGNGSMKRRYKLVIIVMGLLTGPIVLAGRMQAQVRAQSQAQTQARAQPQIQSRVRAQAQAQPQTQSRAQAQAQSQASGLADRFYRERGNHLFWFAHGQAAAAGRARLIRCIDSAAWLGLDSGAYRPARLRGLEVWSGSGDSLRIRMADREFTEAAFFLAADRWRGRMNAVLSYDGVSPVFGRRDDSALLAGLSRLTPDAIGSWLAGLEPATARFGGLVKNLAGAIDSGDGRKAARISATINVYRYIHHFGFDRFIIVNIPSATLYYYSADTLALSMKVVTGQPSKRTPRFAAWCNGLVLYPYWNVPRSIAVHEFLPMLRRDPDLAALADFEVLDERGRLVDATRIDWKNLRAADFPYTIRQTPGCENALGVLKFELTDPFNVYMHDTNFKRAFGMANRYLSHGCIRLENAARLGGLLLEGRLDTAFLAACLRDQQPRPIRLVKPVPVFVLYLTAVTDSTGSMRVYKDIYHLME